MSVKITELILGPITLFRPVFPVTLLQFHLSSYCHTQAGQGSQRAFAQPRQHWRQLKLLLGPSRPKYSGERGLFPELHPPLSRSPVSAGVPPPPSPLPHLLTQVVPPLKPLLKVQAPRQSRYSIAKNRQNLILAVYRQSALLSLCQRSGLLATKTLMLQSCHLMAAQSRPGPRRGWPLFRLGLPGRQHCATFRRTGESHVL